MDNTLKQHYLAPQVVAVTLSVERGFACSNGIVIDNIQAISDGRSVQNEQYDEVNSNSNFGW